MTPIQPAIIEGIKEFGRVVLIAVLPIAIPMVEAGQVDFKLILITAVVAALKGLDKFVHKNPNIRVNGIAPF